MESLHIIEGTLNEQQLNLIADQAAILRERQGRSMLYLADRDKFIAQLKAWDEMQQLIAFADSNNALVGILCYDVGSTWWAEGVILIEEFVLCVKPSFAGFSRYAIAALEQLAISHEADMIVSGCFFQERPQVVTNAYMKNGYTEVCPTYIKLRKKV